eukprot:CAMPEP_0168833086 /NCGR_PEP_ID=MMETSP0727-20121128/2886_1 /TAXON_ID=265536 /ORGANISM="Amphiprora sp., Strain CCMP467" /LENGTH=426 /DNA_ID=CAMNT_0008886379 /DNA_START=34 /DNA_END=1314 /DNA_ORIENTATION=+
MTVMMTAVLELRRSGYYHSSRIPTRSRMAAAFCGKHGREDGALSCHYVSMKTTLVPLMMMMMITIGLQQQHHLCQAFLFADTFNTKRQRFTSSVQSIRGNRRRQQQPPVLLFSTTSLGHDAEGDLDGDESMDDDRNLRISRRRCLLKIIPKQATLMATTLATTAATTTISPAMASSSLSSAGKGFQTQAQAEYTNSITASRDTNVSPKEAYDSILNYIPPNPTSSSTSTSSSTATTTTTSPFKALDVGAGAGLSTSYLYNQLGYKVIDAVDWSGDAWRQNVVQTPARSVQFYELDDDSFFDLIRKRQQQQQSHGDSSSYYYYHVICYNFAINPSKAARVAREFLDPNDPGAVLLAPINDRAEYWYKQTYYVLNNKGQVLQKSAPEVGAWSVQFQPDVTSPTCTGIWCGDMNGFNQQRAARMAQQQQ